ncbi:MAG: hypothetical protein FJZ09_01035 [Candidatus Omnitrophica bacterium]|nr:hypothetical protein [Candidatus Omnitrophota bacterium]
MVRFSEIFNASVERTAGILLRPFSPKKWFLLTFIAILAGALIGGGFNFRLPPVPEQGREKETQVSKPAPATQGTQASPKEEFKKFWEKINNPLTLSLIATGIISVIFLLILSLWLSCRFAFVFLEDVVKNDASIKAPFRENKQAGNSFFLFSLALATIFLFLFGALVAAFIYMLFESGAFISPAPQAAFKFLAPFFPAILIFIILAVIYGVISLIARDFLLPIMYAEGVRIKEAWQRFTLLFKANKGEFLKFILLRIAVQLVASFVSGIIAFMAMIGLIIPAGILTLVFYLLYLATPAGLRLLYFVFLIFFCVPLAGSVIFCLTSLYLPFSVLLRVLSVKFIGRLDPRYDLFRSPLKTEVF